MGSPFVCGLNEVGNLFQVFWSINHNGFRLIDFYWVEHSVEEGNPIESWSQALVGGREGAQ